MRFPTDVFLYDAYKKEEDKKKAYKIGVVDCLAKPVEADELVAKINKALRFKLK